MNIKVAAYTVPMTGTLFAELYVQIFHIFQYALPHLRKTKGNIIQDSSLVAEIGQPGAVPYVATKVRIRAKLFKINDIVS